VLGEVLRKGVRSIGDIAVFGGEEHPLRKTQVAEGKLENVSRAFFKGAFQKNERFGRSDKTARSFFKPLR